MNDLLTENRRTLKDIIRAQGQALAAEHELSFKMLKGSFNRGTFTVVTRYGVPAIEKEMHWFTVSFITADISSISMGFSI